jgi:imidazolonepropionase-like amidohydrolase
VQLAAAGVAAHLIERRTPVCPAFTFQANLVDHGPSIGTDPALVRLFEREIVDSAESMKRLHRAGVPLLCGSEAGFSMVPYGHWHHREMEVFVKYFGMTPLEALSCATRNGAIALKMEGQVGVVAEGMRADLVSVRADPSIDVGVLGNGDHISSVWVDGRPVDLSPPRVRRPLKGWTVATMGGRLQNPRIVDAI